MTLSRLVCYVIYAWPTHSMIHKTYKGTLFESSCSRIVEYLGSREASLAHGLTRSWLVCFFFTQFEGWTFCGLGLLFVLSATWKETSEHFTFFYMDGRYDRGEPAVKL